MALALQICAGLSCFMAFCVVQIIMSVCLPGSFGKLEAALYESLPSITQAVNKWSGRERGGELWRAVGSGSGALASLLGH